MTFICMLVAMVMAITAHALPADNSESSSGAAGGPKLSEPVPMVGSGLWASMLAPGTETTGNKHPLSLPTGMGLDAACDDGKTNAMKDWNGYCQNLQCTEDTITVSTKSFDVINCLDVAEKVELLHYCMDHNLTYDNPIPQLGNHRPVWPVYGEYSCMPPQRWLHSVEHGGLVMLYHPCADPEEVSRLRAIVKGCLRKYIIAGYELVPKERPLALVAWGCRFLMNKVDEEKVKNFIKEHALHGNEGNFPYDGDYNYGLLQKSDIVQGSTFEDSLLCPE